MALSNRLLAAHQPPAPPKLEVRYLAIFSRLRAQFNKRKYSQEQMQLADVTSAFALLLENGLPASVAIRWLQPRLSGFWNQSFGHLVANLDLGADLVEELDGLSQRTPIVELDEFTQKLQISIVRGSPAAHQISQLSGSIRQQVIKNLTRRAGQNETMMLIPTVFLILPVTVLFAIFPSLLVLQSNYQ